MKNRGYVSQEQAVWLKKDGISQNRWLDVYYIKDREDKTWMLATLDSIPLYVSRKDYMYAAPPITEALSYMREKYGLYVTVGLTDSFLYKGEVIHRSPTTRHNGTPKAFHRFFDYKTVNGVLLTALDFMIEVVRNGSVKIVEGYAEGEEPSDETEDRKDVVYAEPDCN